MGSVAFAASLPDLSPDEIALDVEQRIDARTGDTEYVAQDFDPFEDDPTLAGSASLRSVVTESTIIDGRIVRDGAFLDVSAIYTTNSSDPYDVRGYEQAIFPSGEPIGVLRYDNETLDCSRDVKEVTYDDGYYRGASYGLIAGIYRLYPRYRGHRHFGWHRGNGWNRGGYGYWRRGYRPGYRDGWRRRGHGSDGVHRPRRPRDGDVDRPRRRTGDGGVDRPRRRPGDVDRPRRRPDDVDRPRRRPDDVDRPRRRTGDVDRPTRRTGDGTVDRPRRRPGEVDRPRRRPDGVDRPRPRTGGDGVDRPRRRPVTDRPDRRPQVNTRVKRSDNPVVYRRPPNMEEANGRSRRTADRPKRRRSAEPAPRPRTATRTTPSRTAPSRPATRPNVSRPRPTARQPEPRRVQRPKVNRPPVSRPASRPAPRPQTRAPKPAPKPVSRPRVNRDVDRNFRKDNPRVDRNKQREFYPMVGAYSRTDVYVSSRCAKEESLTLHIPADRLDAARFDGLVVILLDRNGKDLPVFVPPNYVEGFRLATGRASVSYKNPSSDPYFTQPSSRDPIIYGDPGSSVPNRYPQE